jgi:hypothetical protein
VTGLIPPPEGPVAGGVDAVEGHRVRLVIIDSDTVIALGALVTSLMQPLVIGNKTEVARSGCP